MNYRKEIDGLRAIAVSVVIFFHAGFSLFSGGYVGVDIFFVISGFLIGGIIFNEIDTGTFSFRVFYERRARRILPALYFVMFINIAIGWFLLTPMAYQKLFASSLAVTLFGSNIYFWKEAGYFEAEAELQPLLHTWSLSVEEQYYFFLPIFLCVLWRLGHKKLLGGLILLTILSFLLSEIGWRFYSNANYYLVVTRAWELLLGTICAFVMFKGWTKSSNTLTFLGLLLILSSIFIFNDSTPFPSFFTLIPVVGTALVLIFCDQTSFCAKYLSERHLVKLGLISYSTYLWHQPLLVYSRKFHNAGTLDFGIPIVASILSFILGYLTWKFIELPFRKINTSLEHQPSKILPTTICLSIGFITLGLAGTLFNGFPSRLDEKELHVLSYLNYPIGALYKENICFLSDGKQPATFPYECQPAANSPIILWGDSHAAALAPGFRNNTNLGQYTASSCPPIIDHTSKQSKHCAEINNIILREIITFEPEILFLHANWRAYIWSEQNQNLLLKTISEIQSALPQTKVVIIGGVPQWIESLPESLLRENQDLTTINFTKTLVDAYSVNDADLQLKSLISKVGKVEFVSVLDHICVGDRCQSTVQSGDTIAPMAWDYGHLTEAGSNFIFQTITQKSLTCISCTTE